MAYLTIGKMNGVGKLQKNTPVTVGAGSMDNYVDVAGTVGTFGWLTKDSGIRALIAGQIDWENRWTFKCYFSIALAGELRQSSRWIINGRIFSINSYEKIGEKNFNYRFYLTEKEAVLPETGDPDASLFIANGNIQDGTTEGAIQVVTPILKTIGTLWTSSAIWPIAGGTELAHKLNLKNPLDTDAANRLLFPNGMTHSANGMQGNGTNQYADTFLTPSTFPGISQNSAHIAFYARTAGGASQREMGLNGTNGVIMRLIIDLAGSMYGEVNAGGSSLGAAPSPIPAFYIISRVASNEYKVYRNGVVFATVAAPSTGIPNNPIYLCANNEGGSTAIGHSSKQCAWASAGGGLTPAEALAYYNAVQTFQTTLGRNI